MIFVTHDLSVASGFCHRVIVLDRGGLSRRAPVIKFLTIEATISRTLVDACPRLDSLEESATRSMGLRCQHGWLIAASASLTIGVGQSFRKAPEVVEVLGPA